MQVFSALYPGENRVIAIGLKNALASGETITGTPTIAVGVHSGTDQNPAAIKVGAAVVLGQDVLQRMNPLIDAVHYRLVITASTNLGNTIIGEALLPVQATQ